MTCFVVNNDLFLAIGPACRNRTVLVSKQWRLFSTHSHNVELTRNVQTFIPALVPQVSTSSDLLPVLEISK